MKCADEIASSGDIIRQQTARNKSSMKGLRNAPITTRFAKSTHHKRTKIPPIKFVQEFQSSVDMERTDEILSSGGEGTDNVFKK